MKMKQLLNHAFRLLVIIIIAAFFAGCTAPGGKGQRFTLQEAQPNTATVYHYRLPAFKGGAVSWDVLSNGAPLTRIGNGGFFKEVVEPGQIEYRTKYTQELGLQPILILINNAIQSYEVTYTLNAEAGKLYFLKWTIKMFSNKPTIEQVTQQEALQQLAGLQSFFSAQTSKKAEP
jgi:hypothetical protein